MTSRKDRPSFKTALEARQHFRQGLYNGPTSGIGAGFAHNNFMALDKKYAKDFEQFCKWNPKPCPLLEVIEDKNGATKTSAEDGDVRKDLTKYRVVKGGKFEDVDDIEKLWTDDTVGFLVGCSFGFEYKLVEMGIPMRAADLNVRITMFNTNIPCKTAGPFKCNMVVSMRPMKPDLLQQVYELCAKYPGAHGTPICEKEDDPKTIVTDPKIIGIEDLQKTDYGDPVPIYEGEVPVFWACGRTMHEALKGAGITEFMTNGPGTTFIADTPVIDAKVIT